MPGINLSNRNVELVRQITRRREPSNYRSAPPIQTEKRTKHNSKIRAFAFTRTYAHDRAKDGHQIYQKDKTNLDQVHHSAIIPCNIPAACRLLRGNNSPNALGSRTWGELSKALRTRRLRAAVGNPHSYLQVVPAWRPWCVLARFGRGALLPTHQPLMLPNAQSPLATHQAHDLQMDLALESWRVMATLDREDPLPTRQTLMLPHATCPRASSFEAQPHLSSRALRRRQHAQRRKTRACPARISVAELPARKERRTKLERLLHSRLPSGCNKRA